MIRTMSLSLLAGAAVSFGATGVALGETDAPAGASSDEVRALVADMLADAETRSSLLQSGGTAGHDGKFFLASPDGAFRLNISGQMQIRYIANFRDEGDPATDPGAPYDDFESGFQNRRMKLAFDGHVYNDFFYKVQFAFGRTGGGAVLQDAYVGYEFENGLKLRAGQFKLPFLREELVSSKRQLAVDRSYTNEIYNQDRSQGIELGYETDNWRIAGAFSDGIGLGAPAGFVPVAVGTDNTDFNDPAESDWALTARFEWLGAGTWNQFKGFSSPRSNEGLAWMLGAAMNWQNGAPGSTPADRDTGNMFGWTIDASFQGSGWNAFGAFTGRHGDADFFGGTSVDEYGWVAQGGIFVTEDIEPFLRWDMIIPDSGSAFNTLTAGANWYLHGNAAKFTVDVQYWLDDPAGATVGGVAGLPANDGIGYLGNGTEDGEFAIRAQFQLLF